ncbi:hypothetical protein BH11MYX2_BH11MYX2_16660 [soil metagenome]
MLVYKFVELTTVTDDMIERAVNEKIGEGWTFDGIRFIVHEHSKRPPMAFISFTRDQPDAPPKLTSVD